MPGLHGRYREIHPDQWDRWTWLALVALIVGSLLLLDHGPGFEASAGLAAVCLLIGLVDRAAAALRRRWGRR